MHTLNELLARQCTILTSHWRTFFWQISELSSLRGGEGMSLWETWMPPHEFASIALLEAWKLIGCAIGPPGLEL